MTLNRNQIQMLTELVEAGHGRLEKTGRVSVPPINRPITGDSVAWLSLVARGLVAGERGFIIPTEDGRHQLGLGNGSHSQS